MPALYALLIAIDHYPPPLRPLQGCTADLRAMHDFLARRCAQQQWDFRPLTLTNEAATYANVVQAFQYFKQAEAADTCLLYFSGHGSRIEAPDFWEAFDGKNQTWALHDSRGATGNGDLVNKEISALIYEVTREKTPHMVVLTDCCHAGAGTRAEPAPFERLAPDAEAKRPLESYYGFPKYYQQDADTGKWSALKAPHIQLAACRPHQTAKEVWVGEEIRGAFTTSLLETLESADGAPGYADLMQRVAQKIANRAANQTPQVESVAGADPAAPFLGQKNAIRQPFFIAWDVKTQQWQLNAGLLQGLDGPGYALELVDAPGAAALPLGSVGLATSPVLEAESLDLTRLYSVRIKPRGAARQTIALDCDEAIRTQLLEAFDSVKPFYAAVASGLDQHAPPPPFKICGDAAACWLVRLDDATPLFGKIPVETPAQAVRFWQNTEKVLHWYRVLHLHNPQSFIRESDFEIKLYRREGEANWTEPHQGFEAVDWRDPGIFSWRSLPDGRQVPPTFKLRIKSRVNRPLYATALYLGGATYAIANQFLKNELLLPVAQQPAGYEGAWLTQTARNGATYQSIGLGVHESRRRAGIFEQADYLKIMVSTADLPTDHFNQPGIETESRCALAPDDDQPDWIMQVIPLRIIQY